MTKEGAIFNFWADFGLRAYEENAVPTGKDKPDFPYITYQVSTDDFGNEIPLTGSLWYRSTSWLEANSKVEEVSRKIGRGGKIIPVDDGAIWIKKGTPFSQSMSDETDAMIKRIYLNITVEFLTIN